MRLRNGSQIVIIGGGPAGSFTALHLLDQAAKAGLELQIKILEARDFTRPGPGGCNKCAGILSSSLVQNLGRLNLQLPPEIIQSQVDTYILHWDRFQLPIQLPDPKRRILTVYRGSGPRLGDQPRPLSFDQWLLHQAEERGAEVHRMRAMSVQAGSLPSVITARETIEADLVILAAGINSHLLLDPALGYRPPRTEVMALDEIALPVPLQDNSVHIFFDHPDRLIFGGLIPKGRFTNVCLLGHSLSKDAVSQFLSETSRTGFLPAEMPTLCGCNPQVAISPAQGFFSDRFAAVGDAAVTRLYKDGIGSAFLTAEAAAQTAVQRGVSRQDFQAGYQPACQRIARDNFYGQLIFQLWSFTRRSLPLQTAWMQAILHERCLPPEKRIHTLNLWGMFTGDEPYRTIFYRSISAKAIRSILTETVNIGGLHERYQPGAGAYRVGQYSGSNRRWAGGYSRGYFTQARRTRSRSRSSGNPC